MEKLFERITINPEICNGKPIIRGMRITVTTILEAFPILEKEDILACLEFAKKIADKTIFNYDLKAS